MQYKNVEDFFYHNNSTTIPTWHSVVINLLEGQQYKGVISTASMAFLIGQKKSATKIIVGIDNLLQFFATYITQSLTTRYQILFYVDKDAHALGFDFYYDTSLKRCNIVCFDPSQSIDQYNSLKSLTSSFKNISYHVIGCQAGIQKDSVNCSLFVYLALREFAKQKNIYNYIVDQNAFLNTQPTFQVNPFKKIACSELTNVSWTSISTQPLKIILSGQSFSEMEANLNRKEGQELIQSFKQKHNFTSMNLYIWKKRVNFGKRFVGLGNQFFNLELLLGEINYHSPISDELNLYFSEQYTGQMVNYLNDFIEKVQSSLKLCPQFNTWYTVSSEQNRLQARVTMHPKSSTMASKFCEFLEKYHIQNKCSEEDGFILFFKNKACEIVFFRDFVKPARSFYKEFETACLFPKITHAEIIEHTKTLFHRQEYLFIIQLLECAIQINNVSYLTMLLSIIVNNQQIKTEDNHSWLNLAIIAQAEKSYKFLIDNKINTDDKHEVLAENALASL